MHYGGRRNGVHFHRIPLQTLNRPSFTGTNSSPPPPGMQELWGNTAKVADTPARDNHHNYPTRDSPFAITKRTFVLLDRTDIFRNDPWKTNIRFAKCRLSAYAIA